MRRVSRMDQVASHSSYLYAQLQDVQSQLREALTLVSALAARPESYNVLQVGSRQGGLPEDQSAITETITTHQGGAYGGDKLVDKHQSRRWRHDDTEAASVVWMTNNDDKLQDLAAQVSSRKGVFRNQGRFIATGND